MNYLDDFVYELTCEEYYREDETVYDLECLAA